MTVPAQLQAIADDFLAIEERDRLELLLDFSRELPELPERFAEHPELLERVVECQSPVSIVVEIVEGLVHVHATAPEQAPTTRGFASILVEGLDGSTPEAVLDVPSDFPNALGLSRAISPLRLRGMGGMIARIKRQVAEQTAVS